MEWIQIGTLLKPFGLKGEMKVYSMTDFPEERLAPKKVIYLEKEAEKKPFTIASFRMHKGQPLISFEGFQDINRIESYSRSALYVRKSDLPALAEGEYYFYQLKGLEVYDQQLNRIGTVMRMETGAAHNLIRILTLEQKEVLVPYVEAFVRKVDLEHHRILIRVIEGLL